MVFMLLVMLAGGQVFAADELGTATDAPAVDVNRAEQDASSAVEVTGSEQDASSAIVEQSTDSEETDPGAITVEDDFTGDEDFSNGDIETLDVFDPIEPFNRGMFWFNDKLYFYLFKPIARGYRVVPEPARESVSNFFSNLGTPVRFANSLLQLKIADAGTELGRLIINSTLGIGGLFDPAKAWFDLDRKEEDFGQTLGNYGVGSGFYIVWPIFGPSNTRDTVGMVGDFFLDPLHYIEIKPVERVGLTALDKETDLSLDKDTYESIQQEALDPYLFVRNAYEQYRDGKIKK
ncbi:MAG: VacJ family lipoprotein [Pedobacter sp.]